MVEDGAPEGLADTAPSPSSEERGVVDSVLDVGTSVTDRLTVVRLLGRGGQGDVYEVEDAASGERQAIKVLSAELSRDPTFVKRLEHEAVTASAVDHPNVTRIFGLERTRGSQICIHMELLRGQPLDALLREGALPIDAVCRIAAEVARGLGAAHALGIIHRDVKPQNIFIAETDAGPTAKVMDFGIAKAEAKWDLTSLTRTGGLIGTPAYMSPEQIVMPGEIDHRTDIYSLGLVVFEMLAGRRAFMAKEIAQILVMQTQSPPPNLRALRPEVPRPVAHIVKRCLEKSPFDRPQSMHEIARALDEARSRLEAEPTPISVPSLPAPKRRSALARIGLGTLLVVAAVAGLYLSIDSTEPAPEVVAAPAVSPPVAPPPPAVAPSPPPAPPPPAISKPEGNGVLILRSMPNQAAVFMGRALLGTTPIKLTLAANKTHTIQLTHHGYVQHKIRVNVNAGERKVRNVRLERGSGLFRVNVEPPPPPPPDHGWARVETDMPVDVFVEGRPIGRTPIEMLKLPTGRITLRFVNRAAGINATRVIVVKPGEMTRVTLDLKR